MTVVGYDAAHPRCGEGEHHADDRAEAEPQASGAGVAAWQKLARARREAGQCLSVAIARHRAAAVHSGAGAPNQQFLLCLLSRYDNRLNTI